MKYVTVIQRCKLLYCTLPGSELLYGYLLLINSEVQSSISFYPALNSYLEHGVLRIPFTSPVYVRLCNHIDHSPSLSHLRTHIPPDSIRDADLAIGLIPR